LTQAVTRLARRHSLQSQVLREEVWDALETDPAWLSPWADGPTLIQETLSRLDSRFRRTRDLGHLGRQRILDLVLRPWGLSARGRPRKRPTASPR
jgi:hypothetical protein